MRPPLTLARAGGLACALALVLACPALAREAKDTAAHASAAAVAHVRTFESRTAVTHLAVHWRGRPNARVQVAMSRDGRHFGKRRTVELDDGAPAGTESYGAVMTAYGVRAARLYT